MHGKKGKQATGLFVGAITDQDPREVEIDFSFLPEGIPFTATIYKDHRDAHYRETPTALEIIKKSVTNSIKEWFRLAAGGGLAISLMRE